MERFFRYLCLLLTLPVLLYSGQSFLLGALNDIRRARVGMDVPIALGLSIAFLASLHALFTGQGEIYFDSICMFVMLILGARLIELNYRLRALSAVSRFDAVLPVSARRLRDGRYERVPLAALLVLDHVQLDVGEVAPADGVVTAGESSFDESLLSGESVPVTKNAGQAVVAGSTNVGHPVIIEITRVGEATRFSAIAQLVREAQFDKPAVSPLVERLARWFVVIVLCVAASVALHGWFSGNENALSATIAVLIVSCPCALALATPAALAMAMNRALGQGMMVSNSAALETLSKVNHFFFDKTGTLTTGNFVVKTIEPAAGCSRDRVVQLARSLECYSAHPLAAAIERLDGAPHLQVSAIETGSHAGVSGTINQRRYYIGSEDFVEGITGHTVDCHPLAGESVVVLASDEQVLGIFYCTDEIRVGAKKLIDSLHQSSRQVTILSGDRPAAVVRVARELGVTRYFAACTPESKLDHVQRAVTGGAITAMLGDGINDAPVVNAAHVSIAMAERVNLTATHADIVALQSDMNRIADLLVLARHLSRTIKQNLTWALSYNALAIPFAAAGLVPPWLAALGMSASSLVVILNAARSVGAGSGSCRQAV